MTLCFIKERKNIIKDKQALFTFIVVQDWNDSRLPWLDMELDSSECLGQSGIWTSLSGELWDQKNDCDVNVTHMYYSPPPACHRNCTVF